MPHSFNNSSLLGHCVLNIRPVSSFRPGIRLFNGNPTPIFNAAAVGTDMVRDVSICGGGVDDSVGVLLGEWTTDCGNSELC